jgi:hypothetical protein
VPIHDALAHHVTVPMLAQLYERAATVQAYGDTFLAGAILIALSLPVAFLLARR